MDERNDFLKILYAFVNETRPEGTFDFEALYRLAVPQTLVPVLAYMNRLWGMFDAETSEELHHQLRQTVYIFVGRAAEFEQLSRELTEAGIDHMPVKGWYFRRLYPVEELRHYGDIDVLIHAEDRTRTDELLRSKGFTSKADWEPTYSYVRGAEYYEFHTNLMDSDLDGRSDLRAYFAAAWDHALPETGSCFRPEPEFHFLYALCHLAKHFYGQGAGMRMYLDLALMIRRENSSLDWGRICDEVHELQLEDFFHAVLSAIEHWYGVAPAIPFARLDGETLAKLTEFTFGGDIFGRGHDAAVISARKSESTLRQFFPPYAQLVRRYTYLEGRKWLLPAAWVDRAFRNSGKLSRRVKAARQTSRVQEQELSEYDAFMRRMGL